MDSNSIFLLMLYCLITLSLFGQNQNADINITNTQQLGIVDGLCNTNVSKYFWRRSDES